MKNKYWFKRRRYGYGWIPVTWQGWLSVGLFIAIVFGNAVFLIMTPISSEVLWLYISILVTAIVGVIIVGRLKGPAPKWRWGSKPSDNKDEDY